MLNRSTVFNFKIFYRQIAYVPKHKPPDHRDVEILKDFLAKHEKVLVLTGAGISTESGIPDYRSEEVGLYARSNHKPIQYQEFIKYPKKGKVTSIITQNVDRLHHKAGSTNIIELHGSGYIVKCLKCPYEVSRTELQEVLMRNNPHMESNFGMVRPDGDVDLTKEQESSFRTPLCPKCESPLKPDIIFFGDNVPKARVEQVRSQVSACDAIFALGTSLTVYSSYRIILQAKEENKIVAILNIGPTRADDIIDIKVSTKCGDILPELCNAL
ncbi:NAD-dependent protein deacylase Sirt4 isoform X2 [Plodia interpunctella]|uniref:NAD-dependent protein deacylase Sirt4 isoform X2 n=1 Tax=Plodia interpunctella TaxID=58824 RepID=UPI002367AA4D|nr:NAD-dependent protein deacylase Sirt4-like isoform X2 [Plodia interpunctella]